MTIPFEMDCLEDLFEQLDVAFVPSVLDVHRMRILRRFGLEVERIEAIVPLLSESEAKIQLRAALAEIHLQCSRGMRETVPVFAGVSSQLVQLRRGRNV